MKKIKIKNRFFKVYFDRNQIKSRVSEIAREIDNEYHDKNPVFLIVLTGSIFFATDLLKDMDFDCNIQMISAKSYGKEMESSGKVKIEHIPLNLNGRDVVVIEDIIDTGITITRIIQIIKKLNPKSIKVATLLNKPSNRVIKADADYVGFEIPDRFVVGYGLDFAEYGRNLKDIYILDENVE